MIILVNNCCSCNIIWKEWFTMKKVIALALALVMALSCGMMAFAAAELETIKSGDTVYYVCPTCKKLHESIEAYNSCIASHSTTAAPATAGSKEYKCPYCPEIFDSLQEYNDHLEGAHQADVKGNYEYHWDKYIGTDVVTLFSNLVDIFQSTGILEMLKNLVEKIWALIEQGINDAKSASSVAGALSDLEAKVIDLGFGDNADIKGLINSLKQKIKSFYGMNEKATTVEATVAEAPADTGSATAGIAAFAALSMAAAAAYVCTKKKD